MLVILAYCHKEIERVKDLLQWCSELDGKIEHHGLVLISSYHVEPQHRDEVHKVAQQAFKHVATIRQTQENEGLWPRASNALFKCALEYLKTSPSSHWIWLEPDAIPMVPNWLYTLDAEYRAMGKPFFGAMFDRPYRHLNGVMILPSNPGKFNPWIFGANELPFDLVRPELNLQHGHVTQLIWRGLGDWTKNQSMTFPTVESLKQIPVGVILAHCNKDGTLIARLREQRGAPAAKPQTKAPLTFPWPWKRSKHVGELIHIFTDYTPRDAETIRRNALAQTTWPKQSWTEFPVKDDQLPRLWHEAGRAFPYIKDVFDLAAQGRDKNDVLIYTNADICLATNCSEVVRERMKQTDCVYCYRRDFRQLLATMPDDQIATGHDYCGSDLKACRVSWWRKHREKFPDMILGMELWDPCLRVLMEQTNPADKCRLDNLIYHQRHDSYWERAENRYTLQAQKHCLKLGANFLRSLGQDVTESGVPKWYGLECDLVVLGLAHETKMLPKLILNLEDTLAKLNWKSFVCPAFISQPIIESWQKRRPDQVALVSEPAKVNGARYPKMAMLRNALLRAYRVSGIEPKAILWMDMDVWGFWQAKDSIPQLLARNGWDAMAAYGLRPVKTCGHDVKSATVKIDGADYTYYDWLAYEDQDGTRVLWHSLGQPNWYSHGTVPRGTTFTQDAPPTLVDKQVNSAFGPACFYRPQAIDGLLYDENTGQCEHQSFHREMRLKGYDRIFISKDIVALYEKT